MKKINLFLLPLFLYGCTTSQMNDTFYFDNNNPYYEEDDSFYVEDDIYPVEESDDIAFFNDGEQTDFISTEDAFTQESIEPIVSPTQNNEPQPTFIQPAQPIQLEDGIVIEIPEQKVYIEAPAPQPVIQPVAIQPIMPQPTTPQPIVAPAVMITLQNINYPNMYVQCLSTDTICLTNYQQQGYIRLQDKPQFAGYREVLSPTDYPGQGQWQYNHNIPRW